MEIIHSIIIITTLYSFSLFATRMSKNTTQDRTNTNKQGKIQAQELKYIQTFQPMHSVWTYLEQLTKEFESATMIKYNFC